MAGSVIEDAIRAFPSQSVAVIGDVMLDIWEYGQVFRRSPEAPVPVVRIERKEKMLGGAANAAQNVRACGAAASLFGVVGEDEAGRDVMGLLKNSGINCQAVFADPTRPTTQKQRIVGPDGHILRVDFEETVLISAELAQKILASLASNIDTFDAVVIADYAKGVMTRDLAEQIIALARNAGIPVVVDTKPVHISFYKGATVLTPNVKEACEMAGAEDFLVAGKRLVEMFGASAIVTRGAEGMSYFGDGPPLHFTAINVSVEDVSGAGDTATVGVALGLCAGLELADAALLANLMAAAAVSKKGTAAVTGAELLTLIGRQ